MAAKEGSSKLNIHNLIAKYELGRQFERYRFLQKVMDNEVEDIEKAFKFQGMENMVKFLNNNPTLQEYLISQVREMLL